MNRLALLSVAALLAAGPATAQQAEPAAPAPAEAAAAPAPAAPAGPDYSNVEEVSVDLGKGVFMITGAGGNTTISVSDKGIVVVDTQFAPLYDKLRAKIKSIADKPILYVINTHYHGDHVGGNASFYTNDSAVIVAHPQVVERIANPAPRADGTRPPFPPAEALPNMPYTGDGTLVDGGSFVQVSHPVPTAHTDGDSIALFLSANVIATGDIVGSASYPNIDVAAGGNIDGMIAATNWIITKVDRNTKIVPGHGTVMNRADIMAYRDMLVRTRAIIARAKAAGQTADQVASSDLLKDYDVKWKTPGNAMAARYAANVYNSLK